MSFSISFSFGQQKQKMRTILFVGAHPDDETAISEVLYKYARLGNRVIVMIATDGNNGTRVTKIPAGDSLGNIRRTESICGCKALGIEPPIFLGIERLDTQIGTGKYFREHQRLMDSLKARIPSINPDIIITAGPDGDTHHSEHIVIGAAVTELLLANGWVEKFPLYHFAWKKAPGLSDDFAFVDEQYFNVKVSYTANEESKAMQALRCHVTQYTPEEFDEEEKRRSEDKEKVIHFRRFVVAKGLKSGF